jgi:hypothetical protein
MLGTEEAPRTDGAITATISTGWDEWPAARRRGFAAIPGAVNPPPGLYLVAGRRAGRRATRKGGQDVGRLSLRRVSWRF